jgi:hypothetical protein
MFRLSEGQEEDESKHPSYEVTLTRLQTLEPKAAVQPIRGRHLIAEHPESRHRYFPAIDCTFTAGPLTNEEGIDIKAYVLLQGSLIGKQGS